MFAGSYNPDLASIEPLPCPAGRFSNASKATFCYECARNTYSLGQRETACMQCRNDPDCGDCQRNTGMGIPRPGYCGIGLACVPAGTYSGYPGSCLRCDPQRAIYGYTPLSNGQTCTDGDITTYGDACTTAGVCSGTPAQCLVKSLTGSDARNCEVFTGKLPNGCATRRDFRGCIVGSGSTRSCGCSIDGVCYAHLALNPTNPCQQCDVSKAATEWSPAPPKACDDGQSCTHSDSCDGKGTCVGTRYSCEGNGGPCLISATCDGQGGCSLALRGAETTCSPAADACSLPSTCDGMHAACPAREVLEPAITLGNVALAAGDSASAAGDAMALPVVTVNNNTDGQQMMVQSARVLIDGFSVPCGDLSFSIAITPVPAQPFSLDSLVVGSSIPVPVPTALRCNEAVLASASSIGGQAGSWSVMPAPAAARGQPWATNFSTLSVPDGTFVQAIVRARNLRGYTAMTCSHPVAVDSRPPSLPLDKNKWAVHARPLAVSPEPNLFSPVYTQDAPAGSAVDNQVPAPVSLASHNGQQLSFRWPAFDAPSPIVTVGGLLYYSYRVGRSPGAGDVLPGGRNSNGWVSISAADALALSASTNVPPTSPLPTGVPLHLTIRATTTAGISATVGAPAVVLDSTGPLGLENIIDTTIAPVASSVTVTNSTDNTTTTTAVIDWSAFTLSAAWPSLSDAESGVDHVECCFGSQPFKCDITGTWLVLPANATSCSTPWPLEDAPVPGVIYRASVRAFSRSGAVSTAFSGGYVYDATAPSNLRWMLPTHLGSLTTVSGTFTVDEPETRIVAAYVWVSDVQSKDWSSPGSVIYAPLQWTRDPAIAKTARVDIPLNRTLVPGVKVYLCGVVMNAAGLLSSPPVCQGSTADGEAPEPFNATSVHPFPAISSLTPNAPVAAHNGPSLRVVWDRAFDRISGVRGYEVQVEKLVTTTTPSGSFVAASRVFPVGLVTTYNFSITDDWQVGPSPASGTFRVRVTAVDGAGARRDAYTQPTLIDQTPPVAPPLGVADGSVDGVDLDFLSDPATFTASWLGAEDPESGIVLTEIGLGPCGGVDPEAYVPVSSDQRFISAMPVSSLGLRFPALVAGEHYCAFLRLTNRAGLSTVVVSDGAVLDTTPMTAATFVHAGIPSAESGGIAVVVPGPGAVVPVTWGGFDDPESGVKAKITVGSTAGANDLLASTELSARDVAAKRTSFPASTCAKVDLCYVTLIATSGTGQVLDARSNAVTLAREPPTGTVVFVSEDDSSATSPIAVTSSGSRLRLLMAGFSDFASTASVSSSSSSGPSAATLLSLAFPVRHFWIDIASTPTGPCDVVCGFDNGAANVATVPATLRDGQRLWARVTAGNSLGQNVTVVTANPLLVDASGAVCGAATLKRPADVTAPWWPLSSRLDVQLAGAVAPASGVASASLYVFRRLGGSSSAPEAVLWRGDIAALLEGSGVLAPFVTGGNSGARGRRVSFSVPLPDNSDGTALLESGKTYAASVEIVATSGARCEVSVDAADFTLFSGVAQPFALSQVGALPAVFSAPLVDSGSSSSSTPSFGLGSPSASSHVAAGVSVPPSQVLRAPSLVLAGLTWTNVRANGQPAFEGFQIALTPRGIASASLDSFSSSGCSLMGFVDAVAAPSKDGSSCVLTSSAAASAASPMASVAWVDVPASAVTLEASYRLNDTAQAATAALASGGTLPDAVTSGSASSSSLDGQLQPSFWTAERRSASIDLRAALAAMSPQQQVAGGSFTIALRARSGAGWASTSFPSVVIADSAYPPVAAPGVVVQQPIVPVGSAASSSSPAPGLVLSGTTASTNSLEVGWVPPSSSATNVDLAGYEASVWLLQSSASAPTAPAPAPAPCFPAAPVNGTLVARLVLPATAEGATFDAPFVAGSSYLLTLTAVSVANMAFTASRVIVVDDRLPANGAVAVINPAICPSRNTVFGAAMTSSSSFLSSACTAGSRTAVVAVCGFTTPSDLTPLVSFVGWAGTAAGLKDIATETLLPLQSSRNPACSNAGSEAKAFTAAELSSIAPNGPCNDASFPSLLGYASFPLPCGGLALGDTVHFTIEARTPGGRSQPASTQLTMIQPAEQVLSSAAWQVAVSDGATGAPGPSFGSPAAASLPALTPDQASFAPVVFLDSLTTTNASSLVIYWTTPSSAASLGGLSHYEVAIGTSPNSADAVPAGTVANAGAVLPAQQWRVVLAGSTAGTQSSPLSITIRDMWLSSGKRYFATVRAVSTSGAAFVAASAPFALASAQPVVGRILCGTAFSPEGTFLITFSDYALPLAAAGTPITFTACITRWIGADCEPTSISSTTVTFEPGDTAASSDGAASVVPNTLVVMNDLVAFSDSLQDNVFVLGWATTPSTAQQPLQKIRPAFSVVVDATPPGGNKIPKLVVVESYDPALPSLLGYVPNPVPVSTPYLAAVDVSAYGLATFNLSDAESGVSSVEVALGYGPGEEQIRPFTPVHPIPSPLILGYGGLIPFPAGALVQGQQFVASVRVTNWGGLVRVAYTRQMGVDNTPPTAFSVVNGRAPSDPRLSGASEAREAALASPFSHANCHWSDSIDAESGLAYYEIAASSTLANAAAQSVNDDLLPWTRVSSADNAASIPMVKSPAQGSRIYCSARACNNAGVCTFATDSIGSFVDRVAPIAVADGVVYDSLVCSPNAPTLGVSKSLTSLFGCWEGVFMLPPGGGYIAGFLVDVIDAALPASSPPVLANYLVPSGMRSATIPVPAGRLAEGGRYKLSVRAINVAGAASLAVVSAGQVVDTAAPSIDQKVLAAAGAFDAAVRARKRGGATSPASIYPFSSSARAQLQGGVPSSVAAPVLTAGAWAPRASAVRVTGGLSATFDVSQARSTTLDGKTCLARRAGEGATGLCAAGFSRSSQTGFCEPCKVGTWKAGEGDQACQICPFVPASVTLAESASAVHVPTLTDAPARPADFKSVAQQGATCECSSVLHVFDPASGRCVCRPGYVLSAADNSTCTACPANSVKAIPGDEAFLCSRCPAGSLASVDGSSCICLNAGESFDPAKQACVCSAGLTRDATSGACSRRCPQAATDAKPVIGDETSLCAPCPWATVPNADGSACVADTALLPGSAVDYSANGGTGFAGCPAGSVFRVSSTATPVGPIYTRSCDRCPAHTVQPNFIRLPSEGSASNVSIGVCSPCGPIGSQPASFFASALPVLVADWTGLFSDGNGSGISYYQYALGTEQGGSQVTATSGGFIRVPASVTTVTLGGPELEAFAGLPIFITVIAVDAGGLSTRFPDPAPVVFDPTGPSSSAVLDGQSLSRLMQQKGLRLAADGVTAALIAPNATALAASASASLMSGSVDADGSASDSLALVVSGADFERGTRRSASSSSMAPVLPTTGSFADSDFQSSATSVVSLATPPVDPESGVAEILVCAGLSAGSCDIIPARPLQGFDPAALEGLQELPTSIKAASFNISIAALQQYIAAMAGGSSNATSSAVSNTTSSAVDSLTLSAALLVQLESGRPLAARAAGVASSEATKVFTTLFAVSNNGLISRSLSNGAAIATDGPVGGTVLDGPYGGQFTTDVDCASVGSPVAASWSGFDSGVGISSFWWGVGTAPGRDDRLPFRNVGVVSAARAGDSELAPGPGEVLFSTVIAVDAAGLERAVSSDGVRFVCGSVWQASANVTAVATCAATLESVALQASMGGLLDGAALRFLPPAPDTLCASDGMGIAGSSSSLSGGGQRAALDSIATSLL